jgi:hypothetical protein
MGSSSLKTTSELKRIKKISIKMFWKQWKTDGFVVNNFYERLRNY